ncbi:MAG: c-type cytochrome [Geminicoccales bacterium]
MSKTCAALMALSLLMIGGASLAPAQTLTPAQTNGFGVAPPDPRNGEKIFDQCKQCHTTQRGETKIGPSLAGLIGRRPGTIQGFGYSQDIVDFGAAGNFWNAETLDVFLTKPRALMQRTKMAFPGLKKDSDRADLIAYLSQF